MAPIPLDSRAGSITANSCGPPTPATSMSSTAATNGLPKIAEMAAAAPAAPSSAVLASVAGARTRSRNTRARPPPRAISGASGPSTAPSGRLATAARTTPGTAAFDAPPECRPAAGMCPPRPGNRRTTRATTTPDTKARGKGHHHGGSVHPRSWGQSTQIRFSSAWSRTRNQNATNDTGIPIRPQNTNARRYSGRRSMFLNWSASWGWSPGVVPAFPGFCSAMALLLMVLSLLRGDAASGSATLLTRSGDIAPSPAATSQNPSGWPPTQARRSPVAPGAAGWQARRSTSPSRT